MSRRHNNQSETFIYPGHEPGVGYHLGQRGLLQAHLVVQQRELVVAAHQLRAQQVALPGHRLRLASLPQPLLAARGTPVGREA